MASSGTRKTVYLIAGWLSFGIGFAGIFLPLLPTTIFWIIAAGLWSKGHPALADKILGHPKFGQPVRLFLEHRQISLRGKYFAVSGISLSYLLILLTLQPSWPVALIIGLILAAVILWIIRLEQPTTQKSLPS